MIWCYHNDTTCHFHIKGSPSWPQSTCQPSTHIQNSKPSTSTPPRPKSSSQTESLTSPLDLQLLSIVAMMEMMETHLDWVGLRIMFLSQPITFWRYPWRLDVNQIESYWWPLNPDHQLSISSSIARSKNKRSHPK